MLNLIQQPRQPYHLQALCSAIINAEVRESHRLIYQIVASKMCVYLSNANEEIERKIKHPAASYGVLTPLFKQLAIASLRCKQWGIYLKRLNNSLDVSIPPLLKSYLRQGAYICGAPA